MQNLMSNASKQQRNPAFGSKDITSTTKQENEIIVIHVFDENRNINKEFQCEKEILIKNMKYFENYLTEATSVEDIDISVHCDIKIFEWLMRYLKYKDCKPGQTGLEAKDQPKLDLKSVISILISSDFL